MKKIFTLLFGIISILQLHAQNEIDALRYSQNNLFGTAKFSSMSGAFGSLGGDFSTLSHNPAGIAFYQNSELTYTPNFSLIENSSYLNNNKNTKNNSGFNTGNFGYIAVANNDNQEWKRINIGFGYNQLACYNSRFYIETENDHNSLADLFLERANGEIIDNLDPFHAGPAFWSDLIDLENNEVDTITNWYAFDNGNYISNVNSSFNKTQEKSVVTEGFKGEYVFSLGSSYNEQIYFGATIGIPTIEYAEKSKHTESNFADTLSMLENFTYTENITAYGSGINLKLGAIMRVGNNTKIGGAIHSPSYISMEEEYSTSVVTEFRTLEENVKFVETSPYGYFTYEITTPWKAIASASTILNNQYLLSAEIEKMDYAFTRFYSDSYSFEDENKNIEDLYTKATNLKLGAEAKFNPFSVRAGYAFYGSPFKNNTELSTENFSFGMGIDLGGTFFDVSYVLSQGRSDHSMYSMETETAAVLVNTKHYMMFTLGFRY